MSRHQTSGQGRGDEVTAEKLDAMKRCMRNGHWVHNTQFCPLFNDEFHPMCPGYKWDACSCYIHACKVTK